MAHPMQRYGKLEEPMSDRTLDDSPIFRVHIPDEDGLSWRSLISNLETGGILERIVPCEHGNYAPHELLDSPFGCDGAVGEETP